MNLVDLEGKKVKEIKLPSQFNEEYHENLIWRAVLTIQNNKRQAYGAFTEAGKGASAKLSRRKINKKENRKAIRSALSAVLNKDLVIKRNHKLPSIYPIAIENKFQDLSKTKEIINVLNNIGLKEELARLTKKIRAGRGKSRGRRYRHNLGPLIVVSDKCKLMKSAENILGINVVQVNKLNAELLAPGAVAGRLTIFTEGAIEKLQKENLFI